MRIQRLLAFVILASFALTAISCAAIKKAQRRSQYIEQQMDGYTYDKPLSIVWPHARSLLFEKGYTVKNTGEGSTTLETEWRFQTDERTKFLAQGVEIDDTQCKITFTRQHAWGDGSPSTKRDTDMEFDLLRVIDPAAANQISADAENFANTQK